MAKHKIISQREAKAKGLNRYFTGKPCKHGHVSLRKVSNFTCLECIHIEKKAYREKNIVKVKEYFAEYKKNNHEKLKASQRKHYHENKEHYKEHAKKNEEKIRLRVRKWRLKNRERLNKYDIEYKERHKEHYRIYNKEYKKKYVVENREKINKQKREYMRKRKATDPGFKTATILRTRMRQLINEGKMKKHSTSITEFAKIVVGLPQKEFLEYIELQFYPHPVTGKKMTWKNQTYRGWHLDHIKPVSKFDLT